jgi:hypothetical protein
MTAGLPGTGIGGLFYLLLVLFMPLREAFRVVRGRGDSRRWRAILGLLALAVGILAALWFEAWVLFEVFGVALKSLAASASVSARQAARAASFATLASLGLVLFGLAILRLLVRRPLPGARRCTTATRASSVAGSEIRLALVYARETRLRASTMGATVDAVDGASGRRFVRSRSEGHPPIEI